MLYKISISFIKIQFNFFRLNKFYAVFDIIGSWSKQILNFLFNIFLYLLFEQFFIYQFLIAITKVLIYFAIPEPIYAFSIQIAIVDSFFSFLFLDSKVIYLILTEIYYVILVI